MRRATQLQPGKAGLTGISIHALLAESDRAASITPTASRNFYPRSPCGERPRDTPNLLSPVRFLSTLSLRRATPRCHNHRPYLGHFYPRSPCGERRADYRPHVWTGGISIHALLAESDPRRSGQASASANFYPRSPCGERPYGRINDISRLIFLSTLSLRRATLKKAITAVPQQISIHALLAESDHDISKANGSAFAISIHALLAESDLPAANTYASRLYFYPRSPCGERLDRDQQNGDRPDFYPRSPCGERP